MVQQIRFLIQGQSLTVNSHVMDVSVYVRNLLRNLVDNENDTSDSESDSNIEVNGVNNEQEDDKVIDIPIDNISYDTMERVIRWCQHFYETHRDEIEQGYMYTVSDYEPNLGVSASNSNGNTGSTGFVNSGGNNANNNVEKLGNWPDNIMNEYQETLSGPVLDMWEREFLDVDAETLRSIILASNFLNIKPLLDTTCKIIAELFRGKSPRDIINAFNAAHTKAHSAA